MGFSFGPHASPVLAWGPQEERSRVSAPPPCGTPRRREGWPRPPPPPPVTSLGASGCPVQSARLMPTVGQTAGEPAPAQGPLLRPGRASPVSCGAHPGGPRGQVQPSTAASPAPPHCPAGAAVAITHVRHVACESQRRSGTWTLGDARFPVPRQVRSLGQSQRAFNCSML